jgi:peptidoglycan-N-acetylglucosamine deacetylase
VSVARTYWAIIVTCGVLIVAGLLLFVALDPPASTAHAASCPNRNALGTSRTLVIDPREHIRLGGMQYRETLPLRDREVVLTFDDGPLPPYSTRILDVLAAECVKATYFLVGRMARNFPHVVARIAAEGHTIGTHSQTHPLTFHRMTQWQAQQEVDGGIATVTKALGGRKPAPFFRIPGLLRAAPVESYLASRNLMTWSADIPSDDWRRINDREIVRRTIARLEAQGKGMILLHDIKPATALALPLLLRELKARRFRVVHVVPATGRRAKTATLPHQWRVRHASRRLPPSAGRRTADLGARGRATGRFGDRDAIKMRQAARHAATARVAVILEEDDPAMVASFRESSKFFSGMFGVPRIGKPPE